MERAVHLAGVSTPPQEDVSSVPNVTCDIPPVKTPPRALLSPFVGAKFGSASPLRPELHASRGLRPGSSASTASVDTDDLFWSGTEIQFAEKLIRDIQSIETGPVETELQDIEKELKAFKAKIAASSAESRTYERLSMLWGWATVTGMSAIALLAGLKISRMVRTEIVASSLAATLAATIGFGYLAVRAEKNQLGVDSEASLFEQFLPTLDQKKAERLNILAVKAFYGPLNTIKMKEYLSGAFFDTRASLFCKKFKLTTTQEVHIDGIKEALDAMPPLPTDIATALAIEIASLTVYHSNNIENAGLGISETEIIVKGIFCPPGQSTMSRFLETWTHCKALALVIDYVRSGLGRENLRPSHFRAIHAALMAETPSACPGTWRKESVFISGNPTQVLATPPEIDALVNQVFEYANSSKDHDIEIMINVHSWLARIHPFVDGNGRSIRLVMVFLAMSGGFPGVAFTCGASKYFSTIRAWDNSPNEFGRLVVEELDIMFDAYKKAMRTAGAVENERSKKASIIL